MLCDCAHNSRGRLPRGIATVICRCASGSTLGTVEIAEDEFGHPYVSGEGRQDADRVMRHGPPRPDLGRAPVLRGPVARSATLSGLLEYQGVFSDTLGPPLCLYRVPSAAEHRAGSKPCGPVGRTARSPSRGRLCWNPTSAAPAEPAQAARCRNAAGCARVVAQFASAAANRCRAADSSSAARASRLPPAGQPAAVLAAGSTLRVPSRHRSLLPSEQNGGSAATASTVPAGASGVRIGRILAGAAEWRTRAPESAAQLDESQRSRSPHLQGAVTQQRKGRRRDARRKQDQISAPPRDADLGGQALGTRLRRRQGGRTLRRRSKT